MAKQREFVDPAGHTVTVEEFASGGVSYLRISAGHQRSLCLAANSWERMEEAMLWDHVFPGSVPENLDALIASSRHEWLATLLEQDHARQGEYRKALNSSDPRGVTPLFSAVLARDVKVTTVLASNGAAPLLKQPPSLAGENWGGWTAMQYVLKRVPDPFLFEALLAYPVFKRDDVRDIRADIAKARSHNPQGAAAYDEMLAATERYGQERNWPRFPPPSQRLI